MSTGIVADNGLLMPVLPQPRANLQAPSSLLICSFLCISFPKAIIVDISLFLSYCPFIFSDAFGFFINTVLYLNMLSFLLHTGMHVSASSTILTSSNVIMRNFIFAVNKSFSFLQM
jgi:hypothetical protein